MILHLDADAFFASCAQALNPAYRGKPLVSGKERSIATSISYEAKKLGIKRGMPTWKIKRKYPQVIIVSSDYQAYSLFSKKMFDIVRRFTPTVEEYSIDEAFADISGLRRPLNMTYEKIGISLKKTIEQELGISISVGIANSKVLAKIASSYNKPSGFAIIKTTRITDFLSKLLVQKVWGIGPQTASFLSKAGIKTALEFIRKPEAWVDKYLAKPYKEIWLELQGKSIYPIEPGAKNNYKSISKTKTFSIPSDNRRFVFSQLSRNLEKAFAKARRYNLAAKKIIIFIKQHGSNGLYKYYGQKAKLSRPTSYPNEILPLLKDIFAKLYRRNVYYRATGVTLAGLEGNSSIQFSLFEDPVKIEKLEKIYESVDKLSERYGRGAVYLGASHEAKARKVTPSCFKSFTLLSVPVRKPPGELSLRTTL